jgi:hypothetical protein
VAVGTWLSSIGTIAAVIPALYLARRGEDVRLNVQVGLMEVVIGDGSRFSGACRYKRYEFGKAPRYGQHRWLGYWQRQKAEFAIQPLNSPHSAQYPIELFHGASASFLVSRHDAGLEKRVCYRLYQRPFRQIPQDARYTSAYIGRENL